jgi:four helix bundle protein
LRYEKRKALEKFNSFEEILAWKRARKFNMEIYKAVDESVPFSEDYGLRDQIRRASISVSSNIAEGFERQTTKEFIRFLYMSKGSSGEIRSQLYLAKDLNYLSDARFECLYDMNVEISKLLSGLIKYLSSTL